MEENWDIKVKTGDCNDRHSIARLDMAFMADKVAQPLSPGARVDAGILPRIWRIRQAHGARQRVRREVLLLPLRQPDMSRLRAHAGAMQEQPPRPVVVTVVVVVLQVDAAAAAYRTQRICGRPRPRP